MPKLSINGVNINYIEEGDPNRPTVVFIHSSGCNLHLWDDNIPLLAKDFHCIALDLPGHGQSSGSSMQSIQKYADFVMQFIRDLNLSNPYLCGHSLGTGIIQSIVLAHQKKYAGMILIGGGARLRVNPQFLSMLELAIKDKKPMPDFTTATYSPKTEKSKIMEIERRFKPRDPAVMYDDLVACDHFDMMETIGSLAISTLVITGKEDLMTPAKYAMFYEKNLSDVQVYIVDNAGHMVMSEQANIINKRITDFLNEKSI